MLINFAIFDNIRIFAVDKQLYMNIKAIIDPNQADTSDRERLATCPHCGQKLFEIESIFNRGVFRLKCRRCKIYVRVSCLGDKG